MRDLNNAANVLLHRLEIFLRAGLQQADVLHHVDLERAQLQHTGRLLALRRGERGAQWEPDHYADRYAGAGQRLYRSADPCGVHHRAGKAMFRRFVAQADHLGTRGLGFQQRVIDHGCQCAGG